MGRSMARDVLWCALVLLELVCVCQCNSQGLRGLHDGRKLELPRRALSNVDDSTDVVRSYLVHRDSLQAGTNATASERFLEAVKRSQGRVTQLEKILQLATASGGQADAVAAADSLQSPVSVGSGEYVIQISFGTPAQQFTTIIDTGSDLNWIQCSPCTKCFQQPDALFNPAGSSTYTPVGCTAALCQDLPAPTCSASSTCRYSYSYGDGSTTAGNLAFETVTLGGSAVQDVGFGCGLNQQGTFGGVDGLIGLGQGPLSLPSQFSPAVPQIFSYCLVDQSLPGTPSSPITFGNAAENANVKYTPLVANTVNPTFYYVGVTGVTVGGKAVSIPASAFRITASGSGGVILDSGTTLTYWITAAFNPIRATFAAQILYPTVDATKYGLSLCYDVSGVAAPTFPSMVVRMAGSVNYAIPATNLFIAADNTGTIVCLAMGPADTFSIIGNIQQQDVLIVYDVVDHRVGFQNTRCDTF